MLGSAQKPKKVRFGVDQNIGDVVAPDNQEANVQKILAMTAEECEVWLVRKPRTDEVCYSATPIALNPALRPPTLLVQTPDDGICQKGLVCGTITIAEDSKHIAQQMVAEAPRDLVAGPSPISAEFKQRYIPIGCAKDSNQKRSKRKRKH